MPGAALVGAPEFLSERVLRRPESVVGCRVLHDVWLGEFLREERLRSCPGAARPR